MNYRKVKSRISDNIVNISGFRTNRKLIVFESDDWGSIRMPSKEVYQRLLKEGIITSDYTFVKYDSLASEKDLTSLFEVLKLYKDIKGNHPIFTANTVMTNPDFGRIKQSKFEQYYSEPFITTLQRYPEHKESFNLWKEGINRKIFYPQFHGREHINVKRWMKKLRSGDEAYHKAFENETFVVKNEATLKKSENIAAALDYDSSDEITGINKSLAEGLKAFEELFGFKSKSFIAPNYIWDNAIENTLKESGVEFLQGSRFQNRPALKKDSYNRKFRYTGQKNRSRLINIVRNVYFEPSLLKNSDAVTSCLRQIATAFFWNKPAVISTHRLNYLGFLEPENRERNLDKLDSLLMAILKRWPNVEFVSTPELGKMIKHHEK
jgi:hypothetical protein